MLGISAAALRAERARADPSGPPAHAAALEGGAWTRTQIPAALRSAEDAPCTRSSDERRRASPGAPPQVSAPPKAGPPSAAMDPVPEYSLFLGRILDELGSQSSSRTHQDLCGSLCARFDLVHLAKLRSLLFSTACLEPSFPAALFQDRMRRSPPEPQARKLTVAADIVSIFNLIQMDRDAKETPAAAGPQPLRYHDNQRTAGLQHHLEVLEPDPVLRSSDPNFLLRPAVKDRVPPQSAPPSPQSYFSMNVDGGSSTEPESLQVPDGFSPSSSQRRSVFKEDSDLLTFRPQVITAECKRASHRRDLQKPPAFFNHSFELPYSNPYFEPALGSPRQDRLRVKHESLDDLQTSTYFGPTPVSQRPIGLKHSTKSGSQWAWPVKSLSLNTEEGPPDFKRPYLNSKPLRGTHRCNISTISANKHFHCQPELAGNSPDSTKPGNGVQSKDVAVLARGAAKAFRDKSMGGASFQGGDSSFSVGTQTEQKKARDFQDRERPRLPPEDSEVISDDISDIFRFLDDMSVCDSLGVVQSSRHNSTGSLSQVTQKSDGDSSPERNTIKLAKSKVDRLFHSLENSDDELKLSVCKLVVRIGEIEKKLESLSGVRGEISQVLSKLNKLDQKIQEPGTGDRQADKTSAAGSDRTPEKPRPYPHPAFHTIGHNVKAEWGRPEDGASGSLRMKALKRSAYSRRPSPPLNEENSATESKVASISGSPLDWRTPSHSLHPGDFKERESDGQERHHKLTEVERDHHFDFPPSQRPPKPSKKPHLVEQVFPPHPFSSSAAKANLVYTDLRPAGPADGRRSQPSWIMEENRRNLGEKGNPLTKVDLQVQESLNPGNLEFWMEDVYTPGFDSLLKKKEAEFRRAKACKIGALITAAACTVILVIVVPICTMRS